MQQVNPVAHIKALVKRAGTQVKAAKRLGVSQQYLCDILAGRRKVSAAMLKKLGLLTVIVSRQES